MPKMYMEIREQVEQLQAHVASMTPAQEGNLTQAQTKLLTDLDTTLESLDETNDQTWQVWDALEDAFDKLMEFIGTINIDAIVTLATKAIDLALLVIDAVGGFYANNNQPVPAELEAAIARIETMKPSIGDPVRAAACNMQLVFAQTYDLRKQAHKAEACGLGQIYSFFHDRSLDQKYKDMATWLDAMARETNSKGALQAPAGELSGAFNLVFNASDYKNGNASSSSATKAFHDTVVAINNQLNIFEPSPYRPEDQQQTLTNMDDAIAFSGANNIPVPQKVLDIHQTLHSEDVDKITMSAPAS